MADLNFFRVKEITVINDGKRHAFENVYDSYKYGRGVMGIVAVVSGEILYEFSDSTRKLLRAGDIALFSERAAYKAYNLTGEALVHYSINFSTVEDADIDAVTYFRCENFAEIAEKCRKCTKYWYRSDVVSRLKSYSALYDILAMLFEEKFVSSIEKSDYDRIISLRKYIEEHIAEKLDIDSLAAHAVMSRTNFRRVFRRVYQISPIEYLIRLRLSRAAELLITTELELSEIAERCGFADKAYLYKLFKSRTGYAPSDLRRKNIVLDEIIFEINK